MCPTCGLSLPPPERGRAPRRFCTDACRQHQHRYARARLRIAAIAKAAIGSEQLDRPEMAAQEWALLGVAVERLTAMTALIRTARAEAGLDLPEDWPYEDPCASALADAQL